MTAADILRERAKGLEDGATFATPITTGVWREDAAIMRAVADLMEAVRRYPGLDAQRAALERLIEGERDVDR